MGIGWSDDRRVSGHGAEQHQNRTQHLAVVSTHMKTQSIHRSEVAGNLCFNAANNLFQLQLQQGSKGRGRSC